MAIGGSVTVDGEVTGDAVSIGGTLTLGPDAVVRGDAVSVGGALTRAQGARVDGDVTEVGRGGGAFRRGFFFPGIFGTFWSRLGSVAGTLLRIGLLVLLSVILVAFGRNPVERIAARIAATPVRSGLVGLLAEILFLPVLILTIVVLAVSIIGIPLLALVPFAVVLLMLGMLTGFVGLAYQIGQRLTSRLGWTGRGDYAVVAIGVVAIGALTLIAKLAALAGGFLIGAPLTAAGYFVEYVAWTVGFGAAILYWYDAQTRFGHRQACGADARRSVRSFPQATETRRHRENSFLTLPLWLAARLRVGWSARAEARALIANDVSERINRLQSHRHHARRGTLAHDVGELPELVAGVARTRWAPSGSCAADSSSRARRQTALGVR